MGAPSSPEGARPTALISCVARNKARGAQAEAARRPSLARSRPELRRPAVLLSRAVCTAMLGSASCPLGAALGGAEEMVRERRDLTHPHMLLHSVRPFACFSHACSLQRSHSSLHMPSHPCLVHAACCPQPLTCHDQPFLFPAHRAAPYSSGLRPALTWPVALA